MSLLEAMAAGRPAVATAVGGVPEIAGEVVPLVPPHERRRSNRFGGRKSASASRIVRDSTTHSP